MHVIVVPATVHVLQLVIEDEHFLHYLLLVSVGSEYSSVAQLASQPIPFKFK